MLTLSSVFVNINIKSNLLLEKSVWKFRNFVKKVKKPTFKYICFDWIEFWHLEITHQAAVTSQSYDTTCDLFWLDDESVCAVVVIQTQTLVLNRRYSVILSYSVARLSRQLLLGSLFYLNTKAKEKKNKN